MTLKGYQFTLWDLETELGEKYVAQNVKILKYPNATAAICRFWI